MEDVQKPPASVGVRVGMYINLKSRPVTSDVSQSVRVTLIFTKIVLSKCRKLETSLKSIKDVRQNSDCTEPTSDEWTSLDRTWTHLTSLAEFGSSPFRDGGNEILFYSNSTSLFG